MLERLKPLLRTLGFIRLPRIENRDQLIEFIDSRASYVSQVTLYTYVKARAGTQYPKLFTNEDFLTSLRIARWHIYGAAVCDLCLFAVAQFKSHRLDAAPAGRRCGMIDDIFSQHNQTDIGREICRHCRKGPPTRRLRQLAARRWSHCLSTQSDAVFEWAPIADQ